MMRQLEICVSDFASLLAAEAGGADRIELCANLAEGGTTPSLGFVRAALEAVSIPVFPIIRPRGGSFVFSRAELDIMLRDIELCRDVGCTGLVIGALTDDHQIDVDACRHMISLCGGLELTFHRAFDRTANLATSLERLVDLGFRRVLTSGGRTHAHEGLSQLSSLVEQARGRIIVMAGSGINASNIGEIALRSGCSEFHSTAKKMVPVQDPIQSACGMEYHTDANIVAQMKLALDVG